MTAAQRLWFLLNIRKDKDDYAEVIKNICMHIQPQVYFGKQKPDAAATDFIGDIMSKLGRELTSEEKIALNIHDSVDVDVDVDVDIITRD